MIGAESDVDTRRTGLLDIKASVFLTGVLLKKVSVLLLVILIYVYILAN